MLVSYKWLNEYFDGKLPSPEKLAEEITMHAFEIESVEGEGDEAVIDVKVLPNRAHDCLSHRGIAREIGAILGIPAAIPTTELPERSDSTIDLAIKSDLCARCMFCRVSNVSVGPSPEWLKAKLELLGQRSISNIVDITNYAMLETGQPMHAFDLAKLVLKDGRYTIGLKAVTEETNITVLGGKELKLPKGTLVFTDENREGYNILDIAGMKGGTLAEVDEHTKDIALTAANFNQSYIRRYSKMIGVQTDATKRNENGITPELAETGMDFTISEIVKINPEAKAEASADVRNQKQVHYKLGISVHETNKLLGTSMAASDIEAILSRFGFEYEKVDPLPKVLGLAREYLGKPYRLGASVAKDAPDEFDCSSLTSYLHAQAGISIPRMTVDQYVFGEPVQLEELKAGDLVFSNTGEGKTHYESIEWLKGIKVPEGIDHVGIYMGGGEILHASRHNGNGGVDAEKLSESGRFKNVIGARRIPAATTERYVIIVPNERLDLRQKEDMIEEIGRMYGYDKIPTASPARAESEPKANKTLYYSEKVRETLAQLGFSEVQTYAFGTEGDVEVANPLASDKKMLRANLAGGVGRAFEVNVRNADLLGLDTVKIFEIGTVFSKDREFTSLCIAVQNAKEAERLLRETGEALASALQAEVSLEARQGIAELDFDRLIGPLPEPESPGAFPAGSETRYKAYSPYPFILRDIAVWVPEGISPGDALAVIKEDLEGPEGPEGLLVRDRLFDSFTKEVEGAKRTSYAFRLVFQSEEKTLTDAEINAIMARITEKLNSKEGWQVR